MDERFPEEQRESFLSRLKGLLSVSSENENNDSEQIIAKIKSNIVRIKCMMKELECRNQEYELGYEALKRSHETFMCRYEEKDGAAIKEKMIAPGGSISEVGLARNRRELELQRKHNGTNKKLEFLTEQIAKEKEKLSNYENECVKYEKTAVKLEAIFATSQKRLDDSEKKFAKDIQQLEAEIDSILKKEQGQEHVSLFGANTSKSTQYDSLPSPKNLFS